jgi:hypothetical protein
VAAVVGRVVVVGGAVAEVPAVDVVDVAVGVVVDAVALAPAAALAWVAPEVVLQVGVADRHPRVDHRRDDVALPVVARQASTTPVCCRCHCSGARGSFGRPSEDQAVVRLGVQDVGVAAQRGVASATVAPGARSSS